MVLVLSERANFYLQQRRPHIIPKANVLMFGVVGK